MLFCTAAVPAEDAGSDVETVLVTVLVILMSAFPAVATFTGGVTVFFS